MQTARKDFAQYTQTLIPHAQSVDRLGLLSKSNFSNIPACSLRSHAVLLVLFHTRDTSGNPPIIDVITRSGFTPCVCKASGNITGLNAGHGNTKRFDFIGKAAGIGLDSRLRCGIVSLERNVRHGSHGTDIYDPTVSLLAHDG